MRLTVSAATVVVLLVLAAAGGFFAGRVSHPSVSVAQAERPMAVVTSPPTAARREEPVSLSALTGVAYDDNTWRDRNAERPTPQRNEALAAQLESLAAKNPAQALHLAEAESNRVLRDQLLLAAARGWAKTAPADAGRWALSTHPDLRESMLSTVFTSAVASNPADAVNAGRTLAAEFPGEAVGCGGHLIDALSQAGQFEAATKFAANGGDGEKAMWVGEAFSKWAAVSPAEAARAAEAMTDPATRLQAQRGVIGGWTTADPAAATQYVSALPAGDDRNSLLGQSLLRWTKVDLKAASDWLNSHDQGAPMDQAVSAVATQDYMKPDVAATWAESVVDPKLRSETLTNLLRRWATVDYAAAKQYADNSHDLLPDDRQEVVNLLATLAGSP